MRKYRLYARQDWIDFVTESTLFTDFSTELVEELRNGDASVVSNVLYNG